MTDKRETLDRVYELGVLAVLRAPDPDGARRAVEALIAGGVAGIEITYSTPDAAAVIADLRKTHGQDALVGAGTVTTVDQASEAADAGAEFLVSPGVDEEVVAAMLATGLPTMAGALTPTEVMLAMRLGVDVVKVFPGSLVGPSYLRSLRGPFPDVPLMPTGGVSASNVAEWLAAGAVAVGAGGELASASDIRSGDFAGITEKARTFAAALQEAREGLAVSDGTAAGIVTRTVPTMEFIGVTTTNSSIMKIFPRWAQVLGLGETRLEGRDLPLDAPNELYRRAVEQIREDPLSVGALVTAHKIKILKATRDLFDELDPYAELTGEVSCISKHAGKVVGHAKDPVTAGRTLEAMLTPGYFGSTSAEVLCVGSGGSGTAISVHLMTRPNPDDRPGRIVMVGNDRESLDDLQQVHDRIPEKTTAVEYVANSDPAANDHLMSGLPPGSLVVNATGMGKDIPGSPFTDEGPFPKDGVIWELNYRGELDFLHQARRQESACSLRVEDGWLYFLHGWSEVIAEVFHLDLTPERFDVLAQEAEATRG